MIITDANGQNLKSGDIIDIHQTVNGQNLFIVLYDKSCLDIRYEHDIERKYEYDIYDLLSPNKLNGEVEFTIVDNIFTNTKHHYFSYNRCSEIYCNSDTIHYLSKDCVVPSKDINEDLKNISKSLKEATHPESQFNRNIYEYNQQDIIDKQDIIIGRQLRQIEHLQDTISKNNECNRKRKKDAGYDDSISFDIVWKEILEKSKNNV